MRAKSAGAELEYSVEGGGDETVLLIMGLGSRAADWAKAFPSALAKRYRVVRFDNRGIGRSSRIQPGDSLSDLATDAVAVLDAVGAPRAHVIGISMGGMIAQLMALEHASRVDKLVLMSTHFGGPKVERPLPEAQALFDPVALMASAADPEAMRRRVIRVITASGFSERAAALVDELVENSRREPTHPMAFITQFQAILASDRSARVHAIAAPTLVIHGAEDKLIPPANGRMLAEKIPGARYVELAHCGHMPMHEQPEALTKSVQDFLSVVQ